ncbi:4Fe-4S binding protein [Butyrivibrio fibrisolvens]|uniref:4Fe-4S binding protein n=1 Tax=Butyrivibrio fibrisolvens TaxID=831 RepID=UPI0020C14933|nr:4Fe-4S dicluster-binding protein [Butyrivibrio fibrisolvens]
MNSKKVASINKDICVCCGACFQECPMSAISSEGGRFMKVDPSICVGCGRCAGICPAGCITVSDRKPA